MSVSDKDPYDIKVTQDLVDPTLVCVFMKLPVSMITRCEPGLINLPENQNAQTNEGYRKLLSDALADWMTRGNMRHESKPDPQILTPMPAPSPLLYITHEEIEEERAILRAEEKDLAAKLCGQSFQRAFRERFGIWDDPISNPKKL